jgi:two-component system, OmpR family, catabolic regulation response regulator CreB
MMAPSPELLSPVVLVVDDEASVRDALSYTLRKEGYRVEVAETGPEAIQAARRHRPDAVVLDVMLPGMDGFQVCRTIRPESTVPILLLSARGEAIDRVVGLEIGADDYVVKPFSPREVAARVKAILKRMAPRPVVEGASALFRIDADRVQISYRGQTLSLTRHEFRLLQCLLEQPERVFSREQLLDALGVAADAGYERSIDSHIKSVRAKLRLVRADAEPIQTHRGLGYSYSPGHS